MSDGVKCGGGLSGRKYVSAAEDSVEGDHEVRGGRKSAEAMGTEKSSVHSKQSKG